MRADHQNERLYNAVEAALERLPGQREPGQMDEVRTAFPNPVFFLESDAYIKQRCGLNRLSALYFSMIPELSRYVVEERFGEKPKLDKFPAMAEYLVALYRGIHRERFYAVLLDSLGRKIAAVLISKGSANAAMFDLKLLLKQVVREEARYVVLCHNHPRGTAAPSAEDARCTLRALRALTALGVPLLDHVIVAYDRAVSIRQSGAISPDLWVMQAAGNRILREWV